MSPGYSLIEKRKKCCLWRCTMFGIDPVLSVLIAIAIALCFVLFFVKDQYPEGKNDKNGDKKEKDNSDNLSRFHFPDDY
jgi:hypothetical protein